MAIADNKKRVYLSLDDETRQRLEEIYNEEKSRFKGKGQFTFSDVVAGLIEEKYLVMSNDG